MPPRSARFGALRPTLALALAAAANALILLLLGWRLGGERPEPSAPAIQVILVASPDQPARSVEPRGRFAGTAMQSSSAAPPERTNPAPGPPPAGPVPSADGTGAVRETLDALIGCRHADLLALSEARRRKCQAQLADAAKPDGALNFDPGRAYVREAEPYLARRPRSGCKPRAAGEVSVMGQEGAAAGFSCSWAF